MEWNNWFENVICEPRYWTDRVGRVMWKNWLSDIGEDITLEIATDVQRDAFETWVEMKAEEYLRACQNARHL